MIATERPAVPGDARHEGGPATAMRRHLGLDAADPRLLVHPDDEMLAFLVALQGGDREQGWCDYMRLGHAVAGLLRQVLRARCGDRPARVLDFASGYGRVTRFLLDDVARERLTIADVLPGAVEFQARTFGVNAVLSTTRPEELALAGEFDAIFVTSLFTHLPRQRFAGWLRALAARLARDGVFAFSTHDTGLLPAAERPPDGFWFRAESEISTLETADYGSTYVSERFVRDALASAAPRLVARCFPRLLGDFQDLWVAVDGGEAALDALELRTEPRVVVESAEAGPRGLSLAGWAGGRYGKPAALEVEVDDEIAAQLPLDVARPDVAAQLGTTDDRCGFVGNVAIDGEAPFERTLALIGVDARGERWLAWLGRVGACVRLAREAEGRDFRGRAERAEMELEQAHARIAELTARMAAMRASRFWRLREAWFACKRALRLTDES